MVAWKNSRESTRAVHDAMPFLTNADNVTIATVNPPKDVDVPCAELAEHLAQSSIRQLRQRIVHAYHLQPLNQTSVRSYLRHRIKSAGYQGPELFDSAAQRRLFKLSHGIPRIINVLCNKAMMLSYASGEFYVNRKHIETAAADSQIQ